MGAGTGGTRAQGERHRRTPPLLPLSAVGKLDCGIRNTRWLATVGGPALLGLGCGANRGAFEVQSRSQKAPSIIASQADLIDQYMLITLIIIN